MSIDKNSQGPEPDALELKVSGNFGGEKVIDLRRTQHVEITVRGTVVGHQFTDKYDKNGDRDRTTKTAVVKVDELVSLSKVANYRVVNAQQTSMADDGQMTVGGEPLPDEIVDAEVVDPDDNVVALNRGNTPEGVDPDTGEVEPSNGGVTVPPTPEDDDPDLEWN